LHLCKIFERGDGELHTKFNSHRQNVTSTWGEKPKIEPHSKNNTVLRIGLWIILLVKLID